MGDRAKVTHINDLPPELLVHIFSFYAKSEGNIKLCTILAKVSTAWRDAALAESLWTEMSFTTDEFSRGYSWLEDEDFRAQISCVKTLNFKYSVFNDRPVDVEKLVNLTLKPFLENCSNLQNLNLNYFDGNNTPPFSFDLPTLCPKITRIRIHGTKPLPSMNVIFTWIEKYNTNLTSLILNRIFACSSAHNLTLLSQKIGEFCPNMTIFKYLRAEHVRTEVEILDLNALQAGCPKMKVLCLENVTFMDNDDSKSCFPHLEKFHFIPARNQGRLCGSQLDIVRVLRGSRDLKVLRLIGPIFMCKTMLQLPCKSLKTICFEYIGKTNDLYDVLCQWKHTLTEIDAWCNKKSQQCVFRYIDHYGKNNLESLKLMNPPQKLEQIKSIVRPCGKLRYFQTQVEEYLDMTEYLFYKMVCLNTREEIDEWLDL